MGGSVFLFYLCWLFFYVFVHKKDKNIKKVFLKNGIVIGVREIQLFLLRGM